MIKKLVRSAANFTNSFTWGGWTTGGDVCFGSHRTLAVGNQILTGQQTTRFSQQLFNSIPAAFASLKGQDQFHPQMVINQAIKLVKVPGYTTCCIVILHAQKPLLLTGNIGDSGFYLYRRWGNQVNLIYKSKKVVHRFNEPYVLPKNSAFQIEVELLDVQQNDLVIVGTDGLIDNLFDQQVTGIIKPFMLLDQIPDMQIISEILVEKAKTKSTQGETPFELQAKREGNFFGPGGKIDDITALIGQVRLKSFK